MLQHHDRTNPSDVQELLGRLRSLEESYRRFKWASVLLFCSLLVLIASGAQKGGIPKSIEAERILLRSPEGQLRFDISSNPVNGLAQLTFFDERKQACAALDGQSLMFWGNYQDGKTRRASFGIDTDGSTNSTFWDDQGVRRCALGITKAREPFLQFWDRERKQRLGMTLNVGHSDTPELSFADSKGSIRAKMRMDDKGLVILTIINPNGLDALDLGVWPDSSIGVKTLRQDSKEHLGLQLMLEEGKGE